MIDTLGPYLLILILMPTMRSGSGIAIQEMDNFDSCKAAITQLESVRDIRGYCIAKELK